MGRRVANVTRPKHIVPGSLVPVLSEAQKGKRNSAFSGTAAPSIKRTEVSTYSAVLPKRTQQMLDEKSSDGENASFFDANAIEKNAGMQLEEPPKLHTQTSDHVMRSSPQPYGDTKNH